MGPPASQHAWLTPLPDPCTKATSKHAQRNRQFESGGENETREGNMDIEHRKENREKGRGVGRKRIGSLLNTPALVTACET